jgi:transposase
MALNGNDEVMISSSSKASDMIRFINKIRIRNAMRPICILLDNARIHIAEDVRILAQEIDIHFIYNIPYSPDLNPIEFGWKDFKREISKYTYFNEAIVKSHNCALNILYYRKDGYSKSWVDKFLV